MKMIFGYYDENLPSQYREKILKQMDAMKEQGIYVAPDGADAIN